MWIRDAADDETLILITDEEDGDWTVFSPQGDTDWVSVHHPDFRFEMLDHPANVGPLLEMCLSRWPGFFVDRTSSNAAPWRAFVGRGEGPVACRPTLCGVLLAALASPEKGAE
jgi:hypothetical protein